MFATGIRLKAEATALAIALICAAGASAQEQNGTANTLTAGEKKAGWTLLFDGKTLDGWRAYKKADASGTRWRVEDGTLAVSEKTEPGAKAADIITKDTFEQFELSWEWKVPPGGNSGLKYFILEDRDSAIGHEYQMIDDARNSDAKVGALHQTASFYDVLPPAADKPLKPAGEWNTSRVVVRGQTVEHWLNGKKVLEYELNSPAVNAAVEKSKFKGIDRFGKRQNGHVLLQDHGDQVWFRNIKIRRIG